jgi:hypothetical protein
MTIRGKPSQKSSLALTVSQRAKDNFFFLNILALSHPLELSIEEIPSSDETLSANLGWSDHLKDRSSQTIAKLTYCLGF